VLPEEKIAERSKRKKTTERFYILTSFPYIKGIMSRRGKRE